MTLTHIVQMPLYGISLLKKALCIFLAFVLSFMFVPSAALAEAVSDVQGNTANRYQLVLVVRFAGDQTGDGETGLNAPYSTAYYDTEWQGVLDCLNGVPKNKYSSPTLYSYMKEVSKGQCLIESVAPQSSEDGKTVRYLTLPGTRDSYAYAASVLSDAIAAFNEEYPEFNAASLDGDGDGYLDNVLLVPEVGNDPPTVMSSPLWPHKGDAGSVLSVGAGSNSCRVGTYTLVDTSRVDYTGTVIHETLHVFGAKDLYRAGVDSENVAAGPVGVWDIMAAHGASKLMRPLAITLSDCGWMSIPEVKAGTYTLHAPASGERWAVKFSTSLSDSEYFVAEYRKANTDVTDLSALDTSQSGSPMTIGGSGLVVYRVNPVMKKQGNGNKGDKDYVYIFREDETDAPRGAGAGELRMAQLSASGRNALGSSDMNVGLLDGAITYSDGQNSGVCVEVTGQTDDTITFKLTLPDVEESGIWENVSSAASGSLLPESGCVDTCVAESADGSVCQLAEKLNGGAAAACYNGESWSSLGAISGSYHGFDLIEAGGKFYASATDWTNVHLWRNDGGTWMHVASVEHAANSTALGVAAGKICLFADGAGSAAGAALYELKGSSLKMVGSSLTTDYVSSGQVVEIDGAPAVLYGNFTKNALVLATLKSGAWSQATVAEGNASGIRVVSGSGKTFALVSVQDEPTRLLSIASGGKASWVESSGQLPSALDVDIALGATHVYAAVAESGSGKVRVYQSPISDPGAWEPVGINAVSSAASVGLAVMDGAVLCATLGSADDPVSLRRFAAATGGNGADFAPIGGTTGGGSGEIPGGTTGETPGSGSGETSGGTPGGITGGGSSSSSSSSAQKPQPAVKPKPAAKKITSPRNSISRLYKACQAFTVKWTRKKGVTGYQVRYSTSKKFSKRTTKVKTVKGCTKKTLKVKRLKAKETYYVQVRTYKQVGKKKYYSGWSKYKKVKTR